MRQLQHYHVSICSALCWGAFVAALACSFDVNSLLAQVKIGIRAVPAIADAVDETKPDIKPEDEAQPAPVPEAKKEATADVPKLSSYERSLLELKIEPTAESFKTYLLSLHPGTDTKEMLNRLVTQMGDEAYVSREKAMGELRLKSAIAMETLRVATENPNPEIRWRAKKLLQNATGESDATFFAIFKTIEDRKFKGLAGPILLTLPLCGQDHVRFAARRALTATALAEDQPLLAKELQNPDAQIRMAVLAAFAALEPNVAATAALQIANDPDEQVRMAVGRLLAVQGRRESLALLVSLLDAKTIAVRGEASRTLKQITGADFGFVSYEKDEVRAASTQKWHEWLAKESASAKITPLAKSAPFEHGRLLLCSYAQSKVFEFDADAKDPSKPRWEVQMSMQPWAVQGLPDGRRLVASYGGRKVVEFGPENDAAKPLWESEQLPGGPMGVQRLENGNTLVALTDAEMVGELDTQGKLIKKWTVAGRPVDVQRLDSGNTLVALQNGQKVVEIDNEGNVKWSTSVPLMNPFSAQRLENGNTLITVLSGGKVVEVNAAGDREEWSIGGLMNPYHARRLSNGNTIIADQNGVYEYESLEKKIVWKLQLPHVSRISRF